MTPEEARPEEAPPEAVREPEPQVEEPLPEATPAPSPPPPPAFEPIAREPEPPFEQPQPPPATIVPTYGDVDDTSQFGHEPPFRPRRNPLKMWTYAGIVFAAVVAALIVAVAHWGLPAWIPINRPTFAAAQVDLQLDFPAAQQERRQLPDGTEYFGASGTITNIGSVARNVPPILIVLRDAQDRIVYSWEVYPPKRTLAPGESETVNQAVTDVPRSAKVAEIGWKPS
jgi:hypothetical protein